MNFESIKTFLVLAESKNFNQTAEMLYVSQPTVTARIKSLENELGQTLFIRNNKQVELSPAGVHYLHYANAIFRAMSESQIFMKSYQQYKQQIVVSAPVTNWDYLPCFKNNMISYAKTHPEFFFHMHRAHSAETLERLSEGAVDLGLVYLLPSSPNIEIVPYHQERLVLVSAPNADISMTNNVPTGQNGPVPLVRLDFGTIINQLVEDMFYMLPTTMSTDHPRLQLDLVKSGFGVGLLQESVARQPIEQGELALVDCEYNLHPLIFQSHLIYDIKKKPLLQDLVKYLLDTLEE